MTSRIDPFANLKTVPPFEVKPKPPAPVARDLVDRVSDETGFVSRKANATPVRKRRVYRTGRNRNFSMKATNAAVERFYKMADERNVTLGALLELALEALEKAETVTS